MAHNPNASDAEDCDDCLEILTDPKQMPDNSFATELRGFAKADREHFDEILSRRPATTHI